MLTLKYLRSKAIEYSPESALEALCGEYKIRKFHRNGKVLLKYDRFADKSIKMIRECRGIILNEKTFEVISAPFEKFGNYGEGYAANDIDFTKSKVYEKVDGTCMCLYFDQLNGEWHVQTLGQVEGEMKLAAWGNGEKVGISWAQLFWETLKLYCDIDETFNELDKDFTYVFELCTPFNKVVVTHNQSKLYFLGARNKKTLQEAWPEDFIFSKIVDMPKVYDYNDPKVITEICKNLPKSEEGFVVVGPDLRKVKMKSDKYVAEHYMSTVVTINSTIMVVLLNEQDEWLLSFPEYKGVVDIIVSEIERLGKLVDDTYVEVIKELNYTESRKEFAAFVKAKKLKPNWLTSSLFAIFSGKQKTGKEWVMYHIDTPSLIHRSDFVLQNSNIPMLIHFNKETNSLKT